MRFEVLDPAVTILIEVGGMLQIALLFGEAGRAVSWVWRILSEVRVPQPLAGKKEVVRSGKAEMVDRLDILEARGTSFVGPEEVEDARVYLSDMRRNVVELARRLGGSTPDWQLQRAANNLGEACRATTLRRFIEEARFGLAYVQV